MQIMKQSLLPLKCVRRNITQIKYLAGMSPLRGLGVLQLSPNNFVVAMKSNKMFSGKMYLL